MKSILNDTNKNKYIILLFIIVIFNYILFFKFEVDTNQKIKNIIQTYSSLSICLTVYSLYIQMVNRYQDKIDREISYFNQMIETINDKILSFFTSYQFMRYYYNELYYNVSEYEETDRNRLYESAITYRLLSSIDSIINYIDSYKRLNIKSFQLTNVNSKLKKLLTKFFKSKIFVEHWEKYSSDLALKWTSDYVHINIDY